MPKIRIKSMNGQYSTWGLFLADGNKGVPKLQATQVVDVPDDHWVLKSEHIERTDEPITRPYHYMGDEEAREFVEDYNNGLKPLDAPTHTQESQRDRQERLDRRRAENVKLQHEKALEAADPNLLAKFEDQNSQNEARVQEANILLGEAKEREDTLLDENDALKAKIAELEAAQPKKTTRKRARK
jgi:hypothetical protein